ncbi:hypothetical protein DPEC_G00360980 [Dallia pectoralis]|uniref:Uncharacterized protein n=1 Tax=Dallia pectoralis TaxID=75939 RepID=A0ACC2F127_DALPE|nr:hypothetical protein DPEC_G00360980 [Dallia pectoralis]
MGMTNHFLILAGFLGTVTNQETTADPKVSMHPSFNLVYSGDTLELRCDNRGNTVKWFFNNANVTEQDKTITVPNKTLSIAAASMKDSGSYKCESNGKTSESINISVLEGLPAARLFIRSGRPVISTNSSVVLELQVDEGLEGWRCWVSNGIQESNIKFKKALATGNHTSLHFQSRKQRDAVDVYWCSNEANSRSTPVSLWRSDKMVVMDIQPRPSVLGEKLSLNCVVKWAETITNIIFYKDNVELARVADSSYVINEVSMSDQGKYHCVATYKTTNYGSETQPEKSDTQELIVTVAPPKAVLSDQLSCFCSSCPSPANYKWYYKEDSNQPWQFMGKGNSCPDRSAGIHACRAVWNNGRSAMSNFHETKKDAIPYVIVVILLIVVIVVAGAIGGWCLLKRTRADRDIYQDIPLGSVKTTDEGSGYEKLRKKTMNDGEYETLPTTSGEGTNKSTGDYEDLKKVDGTKDVYHTLGMEGAKTGEALEMSNEGAEGLYHTGGAEGVKGEAGGDGLYETVNMSKEGEAEKSGKE